LIRPSGTEPIYRLYAEAKTQENAAELTEKYRLEIKKIIDTLKR
jgi:phosphomannomutase